MRQTLELALEALQVATTPLAKDRQEVLRAITAIKEALAQPEQEPVAWQRDVGTGRKFMPHGVLPSVGKETGWTPLYATPPERKPLTELEAENLFDNCGGKWNGDHWVIKDADLHDFARAIEAAHGIKE